MQPPPTISLSDVIKVIAGVFSFSIASFTFFTITEYCIQSIYRRYITATRAAATVTASASVVIDVERLQKLQEIGWVLVAEDEDECCSICLEEFKKKEKVRVMHNCAHRFHVECIDEWLLMYAWKCPICRGQVFKNTIVG